MVVFLPWVFFLPGRVFYLPWRCFSFPGCFSFPSMVFFVPYSFFVFVCTGRPCSCWFVLESVRFFLCSVFFVLFFEGAWLREEATLKIKEMLEGGWGESAVPPPRCIGCPCICCFVLECYCIFRCSMGILAFAPTSRDRWRKTGSSQTAC